MTTSFQVFKFMGIYSMIQFCSVTILYSVYSNLSNNQYIYIDMLVIFPTAIFMCYTKPYKYLTKTAPSSSLISVPVLTSVVGQLIIQVGFQVNVFFFFNLDFIIKIWKMGGFKKIKNFIDNLSKNLFHKIGIALKTIYLWKFYNQS